MASHILSYRLRVLYLGSEGEDDPTTNQGQMIAGNSHTNRQKRDDGTLMSSSISQEIANIGGHPHCLGPPTLARTTAMGNSDMGRYTFGATGIMDDYFY